MIDPVSTECPKCGADRVSRGACAVCGLRVDLWPRFDGRPAPDPLLDPAYAALEAAWDSEPAHEAFISTAQRADLLDAAAARYRQALRTRPGDAQASGALHRIALIVTHQQQAAARFSDGTLRAVRIVSTVLALVVAIVAGTIIYRIFHG